MTSISFCKRELELPGRRSRGNPEREEMKEGGVRGGGSRGLDGDRCFGVETPEREKFGCIETTVLKVGTKKMD